MAACGWLTVALVGADIGASMVMNVRKDKVSKQPVSSRENSWGRRARKREADSDHGGHMRADM